MNYDELIKKLNPKPDFVLDWYKNEDLYSDGDIEDLIIELLATNPPESYTKCISESFNWPVYYHLTPIRKNILNWYPFDHDSSVLEIGCGFGAITDVLCNKCKNVTAVELSKRRATGALIRNRYHDNLKIIVGNLNDIEFTEKFDYITLIGVLEYQGKYTDSDNPYRDFLSNILKLLKPGGKLLIAIENRFGIKYWCGAKEDYTGLPFNGINDYIFSKDSGVCTFSKAGLTGLLHDSGFKDTYFYYPLPDYKLPMVVYSESELPLNAGLFGTSFYYTDKSSLVALEKNLYKEIIDNNAFEFFSNSFLVECSGDSSELGYVTFAKPSGFRYPEYAITTNFTKDGYVEKFPLFSNAAESHLSGILNNEENLESFGINILRSKREGDAVISKRVPLPCLDDLATDALNIKNKEKILDFFDMVYSDICKSSNPVSWEDNIIYTLGLDIAPDEEKFGTILKTGYIDMNFSNAFFDDGKLLWFDQEWMFENAPAGFIMYRCIANFYDNHRDASNLLPLAEIAVRYKIADAWDDYSKLESSFSEVVTDSNSIKQYSIYSNTTYDDCINPLKRLMGQS